MVPRGRFLEFEMDALGYTAGNHDILSAVHLMVETFLSNQVAVGVSRLYFAVLLRLAEQPTLFCSR